MTKCYPCDTEPFDCPFGAKYTEDCRYYCGLGVDEDEPYEEPYKEEDITMKKFKIITDNRTVIDCVSATDERQALCVYLMEHPEIEGIELRRGIVYGHWMLVDCNNREYRLFAKEAKDLTKGA